MKERIDKQIEELKRIPADVYNHYTRNAIANTIGLLMDLKQLIHGDDRMKEENKLELLHRLYKETEDIWKRTNELIREFTAVIAREYQKEKLKHGDD